MGRKDACGEGRDPQQDRRCHDANASRLAMIKTMDVSKLLSEYNIPKADAVALAKDVSVECFAPLTPRKVTEEDAKALLEKVFS